MSRSFVQANNKLRTGVSPFFFRLELNMTEFLLANGLRVLHEELPHLRSVAMGIWIGTGSMHELPDESGFSHCLEHMLFKGTEKRSASDIAKEMDRLGGNLNAFTAKDCTCFHTKTLGEDVEIAMDILADMVMNPTLETKHLELEKGVILEEIDMVEDYPEELVHDVLTEKTWAGHPLSYPILGTKENVGEIEQTKLKAFHKKFYHPQNTVLAVAGGISKEVLIEMTNRIFGLWDPVKFVKANMSDAIFLPTFTMQKKKIEQTHLCIAYPGVNTEDHRVWAMSVMNNIVGGGMSSRLFQKIREDLGLVYSVYSFATSYYHGGLFSIYAASAPKKANDVLKYIAEELECMVTSKVPEEEFLRAKQQLRGGFMMSLDSTNGHMMNMGRNLVVSNRIQQVEEIINSIESVTIEDVHQISRQVFTSNKRGFAGIGNTKLHEDSLDCFKMM